ncbi:MAG: cation:proton antiporter [Candidatus Atribacteria bacterium]|nr:cation:proton antiporter [Candidatus Atribacteria bacterium]MBN2747538.1 cation:proton antiporter [Bacteroidales bacterium]
MSIYLTIIILGLLIFLSHVFNELFEKTKIPNVLLLLLIGIIIGPVSGIVTKDFFGKLGNVFTTITLIVILFESGSGLNFKELKKAIGSAALFTILNFILSALLTSAIVHYLLKVNIMSAVFLGAIVGGTSSAVVIPMVQQLKMSEKCSSILILESALSDILCLIIGLALLDGITQGVVSLTMILTKLWKTVIFAISLGLVSGFLWSLIINKIRSVKNSMFTTLAFVFVLYGIVELLGLIGGIAVLSFGILLGNAESLRKLSTFQKVVAFQNSGLNSNERDFFAEIVFIMQTYFFVYVGISIQFASPAVYATGCLIVMLIIAIRIPGIVLLTGKSISKPERTIMSVMTPKGLVPAVLASLPLQRGLAHGEIILDLAYSIVLFSIVICSLLVIVLSLKPNLLTAMKSD